MSERLHAVIIHNEREAVSLQVSINFSSLIPFWFSDSLGIKAPHQLIKLISLKRTHEQHITVSDVIAALTIIILTQTSPMESATQTED